jgi:hypothetical protein
MESFPISAKRKSKFGILDAAGLTDFNRGMGRQFIEKGDGSLRHRDGGWGKPRNREAVRHFPQGFTRDDSPGENEWCAEKQINPSRGMSVLLLRSSAAGYRDERDVICDKSVLRCEDERVGILIFVRGVASRAHTRRYRRVTAAVVVTAGATPYGKGWITNRKIAAPTTATAPLTTGDLAALGHHNVVFVFIGRMSNLEAPGPVSTSTRPGHGWGFFFQSQGGIMHAVVMPARAPRSIRPAARRHFTVITQIPKTGPFHEPTSLPCRRLD